MTARTNKACRHKAGVSLLEMLVALGIFAIISSIVYGTFSRTAGTRVYAEQRLNLFAIARAAISWMERDLMAAGTTGLFPTGQPILFVSAGIAERETGRDDVPLLEVTTASSLGTSPLEIDGFVLPGHSERSSETRVVYRLERSTEPDAAPGLSSERAQGMEKAAAYDLVRYDFRPARAAELEFAARSVIAGGVESVTLRFYDGVSWWESWDSRPGAANSRRVPRMVETRITMHDAEGPPLTFVSGVAVASQIDAG